MFDELSINSADYQAPRLPLTNQVPTELRELEALVSPILQVEERQYTQDERVAAAFIGELLLESDKAFTQLDAELEPLNLMPQLSRLEEGDFRGKVQVLILRDRPNPQARPLWPHILLFLLTLLSMMWAGANIEGFEGELSELFTKGKIFSGWIYAVSLLLILGAHELGHYFAARYHKVNVTLPYFIPLPIGLFGTLGAFIQQRDHPRNRRQLFDIGVSGPLAGLVFAIPILIFGIMTAEVNALPTPEDCAAGQDACGYILEGNSILYGSLKYLIHGKWLPTSLEDMTLNQMAFAGWTGLFITAINLMPVGQWDGGHIFYALFGQKAKRAFTPVLAILILLAFRNPNWIIWILFLFFLGRVYNVPLDDITPLDRKRWIVGLLVIASLVLIFTPSPISFIDLRAN